jgi:hypothetical protein
VTPRPLWRILLLPGAGILLAIGTLAWLPSPFIWLSAAAALACTVAAWRSGRGVVRVVCVNAGLLLLLFGVTETAFALLLSRRNRSFPEYPPAYFQPDDDLGGAPERGVGAHVRKLHDATVVYDVVYTIGANGLRRSPPDRGAGAGSCALFFGDSFMFGEGLPDDQTLPWRVGVLADGNVRVYNFGFHGFGAQQLLAAFERNRVATAIDCRPTNVIYEAIPDHIARAAGYYNFMRHGPRYELAGAGAGAGAGAADSVAYRGHFDDEENGRSAAGALLAGAIGKSWLYRWLSSLSPLPDEGDLRRYVAIVTQAARLAAARYPGCRFDVIYWDIAGGVPLHEKVLPALRAAGLSVHEAAQILPGFREHPSSYALSPFDAHPGARANDLLARYLVQQLFHLTPQP